MLVNIDEQFKKRPTVIAIIKLWVKSVKILFLGDFPGGPVAKTPAPNAGGPGTITDQSEN